MIKVKLGDLVAADPVLREMGAVPGIPQKTSFRLARVIRKSADDVKDYNHRHMEILKSTGKVVPHPGIAGQFWIDPSQLTLEDNEKINKAVEELQAIEVDIDAEPIKIADFTERVDLKPNWLAALHWLIVE